MKIKLTKIGEYWCIEYGDVKKLFENYDAAVEFALKAWKRYYKEQSAYSRLCKIAVNKLDIHEREFYDKLSRTKCKGITKSQYGFLAGIYERQEREW